MTEQEIAYTAGFFDGEGSISIIPYRRNRGNPLVNYRLTCVVSQSYFPTAVWLKKTFGGLVYRYDLHRPPDSRPMARWILTSKKAQNFLILLLPYLQVKKREAEVAIAYQSVISNYRNNPNTNIEHRKELALFHEELKSLKIKNYSDSVIDFHGALKEEVISA